MWVGCPGGPTLGCSEPRLSVREPALGTALPGLPRALPRPGLEVCESGLSLSRDLGLLLPEAWGRPRSLRAQGSASATGAGPTVLTDHSPDGPLRETAIWGESSSHPHPDTRPAGRSGQGGPRGGWEEGTGCEEGAVKTQREGGEQRPKGDEPAPEVDGQAGAPKEWLPGHVAPLGQA